MATRALVLIAFLTVSPSALAEGADLFVFGGPSVAAGDSYTGAAGEAQCSLCTRSQIGEDRQEASDSIPLLMLGVGLVGTEGQLRGGGEILTIFATGRNSTGYSAFVTYAGLDYDRVFVQAGLGVGAFWGRHSESGLERIAGVAHVELGLRLADGFSIMGRGDALVGRQEANHVGTLGLQWVPAVFGRYL